MNAVRLTGAAIASACILAMVGKAEASDLRAVSLCSPQQVPAEAGSGFDLSRIAADIERQMVARNRKREIDQDLLNPNLSGLPSAVSLAKYCVAVGEAARRSFKNAPEPDDAAHLLAYAFDTAEKASDQGTAALAAYRLGLAVAARPRAKAGANSRSGTSAPLELSTTSRCTNGRATSALVCASARAGMVHDYALAARSDLQQARVWLSRGSKFDSPLKNAGDASVAGLGHAARIECVEIRTALTVRLAESAIEAGRDVDPAVVAAIAWLRASPDAAAQAQGNALAARLDIKAGNLPRAKEELQNAIALESRLAQPLRLPEWFSLLAEADRAHQRAHRQAAYEALLNVRGLLPTRDPITEESNFSLRWKKIYQDAAEEAFVGADTQNIAQGIVEAYRQAEIEDAFGSDCVPPLLPVRTEDLAADEIILYPVILSGRLELLAAVGSDRKKDASAPGYRPLPIPAGVDSASVISKAQLIRKGLKYEPTEAERVRGQWEGQDWYMASQALYQELIQPLKNQGIDLQNKTLIIIPDGALRGVPFGALVGPDGRFLIQDTRVAVAPALAYTQPGNAGQGHKARVLAASLGQDVRVGDVFFPELQNSSAEVENAGARKLLPDFTKDELETELTNGGYDVLHLATHASFNGGSARSYIVARGGAIPMQQLREMIAQNRTRGEALDLLILSACETAEGDDSASMGLAGAAVQSGARSAIASLWQVNDASTAQLMKEFYLSYRAGNGKAQALEDAQRALIGKTETEHPYYWAAFELLGGWR